MANRFAHTRNPASVFRPQSKVQLKNAVGAFIKLLPGDECSNNHGPMGEWDVSNVCNMNRIFSYAASFDGDVSKWDVSRVKDMSSMFLAAKSFNRDLSKWDVSRVISMPAMFRWATSFNGDISKWDVSSVDNMDYMFGDKTLFKRKLCGAGWVYLKASKTVMFAWSSESISHCVATTPVTIPVFSPQSRELKSAVVDTCLKLGECSDGPHGPIGEWDVSRVIDMSQIFSDANSFNGDISKQKCLRHNILYIICYIYP